MGPSTFSVRSRHRKAQSGQGRKLLRDRFRGMQEAADIASRKTLFSAPEHTGMLARLLAPLSVASLIVRAVVRHQDSSPFCGE